ncbi:MAG: hypothetical protein IJF87_06705 [Erysipelotrichaceae bacterium]|nr:hypothetical protein [Erysipelotrichaceae bacterium]
MAKTFNIINRRDLLTGEKKAVCFAYGDDAQAEEKVISRLNASRRQGENVLFDYCYGKKMQMHLLPGLSDETVRELSRFMYHTAYVVCKRTKKGEEVLYLSLLKDSALRFKASIPAATLTVKGKSVANPNYFVKELRLCL